ncbi:MAG: alpha/beta fold hydrolase [Polyangiales bacterium]
MSSEAHGFFDAGAHRLFAVMHGVESSVRRDLGVVLVHPFMEERQDAYPFLRSLSVALAERGHPSLRADLYGCGDSAGEWSDADIDGWVDDVAHCAARLREQAGVRDVVLLGLRYGASLAAAAAARAEAKGLALIAPVLRGREYVMDVLRAYIASEMVLNKKAGVSREGLMSRLDAGERVNLFGYDFTPRQRDGMVSLDALGALAAFEGPTLVVDVARTETAREPAEVAAARAALGDRGVVVRAVEPQPLHLEGKVHLVRADAVRKELLSWMEAR